MLEIIKQQATTHRANDCFVKDSVSMLSCFSTYMVINIREYNGWMNTVTEVRYQRTFSSITEAEESYDALIKADAYVAGFPNT